MNNHPINFGVRFLLEIAALVSVVLYVHDQYQGILKWVLIICLPIAIIFIWGVFRVNGDSGKAPVAIPGLLRLILEWLIFGLAVWMYHKTGYHTAATVMLILLITHYLVSYDRIIKLLGP